MGWILAAAKADYSSPAEAFVLGLVLIILGFAGTKTGVLIRPNKRLGRDWLSGYQGDGPPPGGVSRESNPFAFYYIILAMYFFGALLLLSGVVELLFV